MGVRGIGGLFFRARDPDLLTAWYRDRLAVGAGCDSTGGGKPREWSWQAEGGSVVFSPFKAATDYWDAEKQYMLNLRVDGIAELITSLEAAGVAVEQRPDWNSPEIGRFARIHDPEGNAVELWEPPAEA